MAAAGDNEKLLEEYRKMNKSAFVLGYTGAVGKEVVKALLSSRVFTRLTLIGRRTVTYEDEMYKDVVSRSVAVWTVEVTKFHYLSATVQLLFGDSGIRMEYSDPCHGHVQ